MSDLDDITAMDDESFEEAQMLQDEQPATEPDIGEVESVEVVNDQAEDLERSETEVSDVIEETITSDEPEEVSEPVLDEELATEPLDELEGDESQEPLEEVEEVEFDYQANYENIMKPIKVSGKDIEVKSIDDLRSLASMGVDYSRKMHGIKPLRAVGETLAKAGLMVDGIVDEAALTRLIDISNGNKDAMASLLAEQNIDPLDMETDVTYTPEATMVTEGALAMQDIEKELTSRGSMDGVITALGALDEKSKQYFNAQPSSILKLEEDISSGTYDEIMGTVQYERSLGRLGTLSDMEAYIQIAQAQAVSAPEVVAPVAKKPSSAKRKAAGITKRSPAAKQQTYDYANMSDEEFEALTPTTSLY